jgi:hypothetical protein
MKLQNKAMLITYPDSLGHNLKDLSQVMDRYFSKAIGGIHLLPFFPSHGDRGFSPMTYEKVAPEFGSWSDVEKLGEQYYLIKKRAQTRVFRHESSTQKRPNGAFFSFSFFSFFPTRHTCHSAVFSWLPCTEMQCNF